MITGFTARADGLLYGGTEPVKVQNIKRIVKQLRDCIHTQPTDLALDEAGK